MAPIHKGFDKDFSGPDGQADYYFSRDNIRNHNSGQRTTATITIGLDQTA